MVVVVVDLRHRCDRLANDPPQAARLIRTSIIHVETADVVLSVDAQAESSEEEDEEEEGDEEDDDDRDDGSGPMEVANGKAENGDRDQSETGDLFDDEEDLEVPWYLSGKGSAGGENTR